MSVFPAEADQSLANALIGPYYIGWSLNLVLFGLLVGVFSYYWNTAMYERDDRTTKTVIWSTLVLCTVQAGLSLEETYHYGTTQNRSIDTFYDGTYASDVQPIVGGLIAFVVQAFLTRRAGRLIADKRMRLLFFFGVGAGILLTLSGAMMTGIASLIQVGGGSTFLQYRTILSIWFWPNAIVDFAISLALYLSLRARMVGFNERTDSILRSLAKLGLRTAAYTFILALAGAILSVSWPVDHISTSQLPAPFWIPLGPLYGLSIFTTLAAREKLHKMLGGIPLAYPASRTSISRSRGTTAGRPKAVQTEPLEVNRLSTEQGENPVA